MKLAESTTDFEGTIIKSMASCLMTNHERMSVLRLTGQNLQNVLYGLSSLRQLLENQVSQ